MTGSGERSNRCVRHWTGFSSGLVCRVLGPSVGSSEAQNHFLYLGLDRAFLLNLARMAALLYFRLDILASLRHCENDKYCSWNIMCRPVLRHLSSILLSAFVIIQPQYAAPNSQIGTICCFNTSTNSGMGQPKDFSLLITHIRL